VKDVALHLARLGQALRAHGVATSLRDELGGAEALAFVDLEDRDEVRTALRIALRIPRSAFETFDRLFGVVWDGAPMSAPTRPAGSIPTCPATTTMSPPGATIPCEYIPSVGPRSSELMALIGIGTSSGEANVLEVDGLAVDPARRRGDPARERARCRHRLHQALHERLIVLARQPLGVARVPLRLADHAPVRRHPDIGEAADGAVEGAMGQAQLEGDAVVLDDLVPAVDPALAVRDVVVAEPLVEAHERGLVAHGDALAVGARGERQGERRRRELEAGDVSGRAA